MELINYTYSLNSSNNIDTSLNNKTKNKLLIYLIRDNGISITSIRKIESKQLHCTFLYHLINYIMYLYSTLIEMEILLIIIDDNMNIHVLEFYEKADEKMGSYRLIIIQTAPTK
eukprot:459993_1